MRSAPLRVQLSSAGVGLSCQVEALLPRRSSESFRAETHDPHSCVVLLRARVIKRVGGTHRIPRLSPIIRSHKLTCKGPPSRGVLP